MYELDIVRSFSAAHSLRGYNGDCSCLHGHNWTVQVFIRSEQLNEIGIAVDFKVLKSELNTILEEFDHTCLNEHALFRAVNPTSENIARILFQRLNAAIGAGPVRVSKVRVCESPTSGAAYFED